MNANSNFSVLFSNALSMGSFVLVVAKRRASYPIVLEFLYLKVACA